MARSKKQLKAVPPSVNCLLLCDDVLISQGKNKHILHGIIGQIAVLGVPARIGGYTAYIRLSNVHGDQKVRISLEKAAGGDALFEMEAGFSSQSDPLGVYTLIVPLPIFTVQEAGRYMFIASHGGVPLAQSPIEIRLIRPQREESDDHA